ncbi:glycosyltransferase involved in cell wall biosynthesis [Methanocalculus alkaliphilus]|uniref:glycosyltransferase n=1 Tax=Methanocalculus alkaliphilus TaxID=768730 RepID=UPI0020A13C58|nr:glycosyltransferase [Methanocalculus alkaliphilus]MCP1716094.1 glycosyltransferase involved in cell wall biosynthesis [Methanocalculus alkaliphilus]
MDHTTLKQGKNLLVISHSYNNFQKSTIEGLSPFFRSINVLVRTNPFAEVAAYIPIAYLERFKKSYKIDTHQIPENINVQLTPIWYLPGDRSYKSLGNKHFSSVDKAIRTHQLEWDLIHAQFTWSAGYVGAKLKEKYNVPFIVTARGDDIYSLPFKDDDWQTRIEYVLNTADYITTVSRSNIDCIKKLHVKTPVELIYNGYNPDIFYPKDMVTCRRDLNLPSDKKIILTVGNLEPVKGQKFLIDAMNTIIQKREDVLCIIVGAGGLRNVLKRQIHALGLDRSIILTGEKPHNTIADWINASDIFVLPSLNEGNPNVMFETLGCGKPFVGTRVGGIPDIITSEQYGYLVEPGNSDELEQKISIALDKSWNRRSIVDYAEQFAREKMSYKMIALYNKFI